MYNLGVLLVKILNHIYLKETTEFISRSFMLVRNFVLKNYSFASLEFFRDSCLNRDCYQPKYFRPSKRNSQPLTYLKSPVGCFPLHHPCCQLQGVAKKMYFLQCVSFFWYTATDRQVIENLDLDKISRCYVKIAIGWTTYWSQKKYSFFQPSCSISLFSNPGMPQTFKRIIK